MNYIDLHCDTLMKAFLKRKKDISVLKKCRVDLNRLNYGGCLAQFFAIFMLPMSIKSKAGFLLPSDMRYIEKLHDILINTISIHPNQIAFTRNASEMAENAASGKLSAFLTLEDGRAVDGRIENLERFHALGIRLITITWNTSNCFGEPNSADVTTMGKGLTPFGKAAIQRMNELGIVVDVSHLSDGGFWDVAALSKYPFIASHSNCRALCPHQRNLTDEMIRKLSDAGGVIGLNFKPEFVNEDCSGSRVTAAQVAKHARHMANIGGVGCIGIGTDFDGFSGDIEIAAPKDMPKLFVALQKEGFHESEIEKIAWENAQRVIHDVML